MRLRLPELLKERGLTPYAVAKASRGRISQSAIHALVRQQGHFERIAARHLEALCDVLQVTPNELIQRTRPGRRG
jgi:DNA-binding Xre family transcriptional regulator